MVKRSRNQITQEPEIDTDVWEQSLCNERSLKKKRFTVLDSIQFCSDASQQLQKTYMNYKKACLAISEIPGKDDPIDSSHFAVLLDGTIVQMKRAKTINCPALYGGSKICFLVKIFITAEDAQHVELFTTVMPNEVFETNFYNVVLEDQIKKDVLLKFLDTQKNTPLYHLKNTYICRYHYNNETGTIGPVLEPVNDI